MAEQEQSNWGDVPSWSRVLLQTGAMGVVCWLAMQWSTNVWQAATEDRVSHMATLKDDRKYERDLREKTAKQIADTATAIQKIDESVSRLVPAIETLTREVRELKLARE